MPRDLDVAFVAIDEIQLGADFERGHVFTDRMLNRRGREETLVLGAQTVRPMVERLLPGAHVLTRPRLSQLTFAGEKKLTRQPRRTAIVAFSVEEVYAIAELIRRQRGGAAVVLGALSPRTRNAQVALYQSGDVEYLVATDAIGMGLNLDVDHVAFASDRKFDGYQFRKLNPAELAQIAGRAGRAMRDGTFGTTGRCPPFENELVQALESHSFEPLKLLQWRNTDLDFSSVGALQASLAEIPKEAGLTRAPIAEDILVLEHAARDDDVRALATTRAAVERLWEVCQVPDYRKMSPATHTELVIALYGFLMRDGAVPTDWFARQIEQADNIEGDIDTLSNRIAHIRTWTFAANRTDWLADPEHWQGVTRAVEDKLSDALHERLTERFVDRRTSVLMRRMRENTGLETDISKTGEVVVEGHAIGRLDGFMFTPDASAAGSEAKTLAGAAQKALAGEIDGRAARLAKADDEPFVLATDGTIRWLGQAVGKLVAGEETLKPRVRIVADERLSGASRDAVQARLDLWLKTHIEKVLAPLFQLAAAEDVTGIARGVAFQLCEALGVLERAKVNEEVKTLEQPMRATLRKYGVRFGAYHIYLPPLLKPAPRVLAVQLFALKHDGPDTKGFDTIERLAASGRTSIAADKEVAGVLYRSAGYRICGERAVRVDILERLADIIRPALAWRAGAPGMKPAAAFDGGGFIVTTAMTSLTGCSGEEFASILRSLGYRMEQRPKPAAAPAAAETTPSEMEIAASSTTSAPPCTDDQPTEAPREAAVTEATPAEAISDQPVEATAISPAAPTPDAVTEVAPETAPAIEPPVEESAVTETPTEAQSDEPVPPLVDATAPEPAVAEAAEPPEQVSAPSEETTPEPTAEVATTVEPAAQPDMIEVWRPGRPEGQRRPRHRPQRTGEQGRRREHRPAHVPAPADAALPAGDNIAAAPAVMAGPDGTPVPNNRPPHRRRHQRPEGAPAHVARPDRPAEPWRDDRANRPARSGRPDRGDKRNRGDQPDRDPALRAQYMKVGHESRRDKAPDPDSPFAKLAALKAQLEADAKERR
jgi:ATP-dependent RNA helicase SUPV3L1/SUV3